MEKFFFILAFIAKKRKFGVLFTLFFAIYLSLFIIMVLTNYPLLEKNTLFELMFFGSLLSLAGGLFASTAWTFVSWRTRQSLAYYEERRK